MADQSRLYHICGQALNEVPSGRGESSRQIYYTPHDRTPVLYCPGCGRLLIYEDVRATPTLLRSYPDADNNVGAAIRAWQKERQHALGRLFTLEHVGLGPVIKAFVWQRWRDCEALRITSDTAPIEVQVRVLPHDVARGMPTIHRVTITKIAREYHQIVEELRLHQEHAAAPVLVPSPDACAAEEIAAVLASDPYLLAGEIMQRAARSTDL